MAQRGDDVRENYGSPDIIDRVLAAVAEAGHRTDRLAAEMLYPFDQLHGRELTATREHVGRLRLSPGMHVLDVGCGIGGPARYMAETYDVVVTGIDVTPEFVDTANELTRRCGLDERASFMQADALEMPFEDSSFDAALCLYVGMNVVDKAQLCREIRRVLKPGGHVVWSEAALGPIGPVRFPVPWARFPSASFLVPPQVLQQTFTKSGFHIIDFVDETERFITPAQQPGAETSSSPLAQQVANQVVLGNDFMERRQNFVRNLTEGRLVSILIEAVKA
ncbi:MAG TPA: methyltransferase domain-containing protein [Microvirga sp.]|nr:methyltransferase domain-containing protein [Microvirga sp.]